MRAIALRVLGWVGSRLQAPARQFVHGLSLPLQLARALRTNEEAWRRYLRVAVVQSLIVVGVGYLSRDSANEAVEEAQARAQQRAEAERVATSLQQAPQKPRLVTVEINGSKFDMDYLEAWIEQAVGALLGQPLPPPAIAEPPPVPAEEPASTAQEKPSWQVPQALKDEFQYWAALFATMQIVQWIVIALSRDYHDAISRDASLLSAIEPEDEPLTPRVRVDLTWMGKKFSRRVRALIVFGVGVPIFFLFTAPFGYWDTLWLPAFLLWTAYWLAVFTTSKTALSWQDKSGRAPWFLRAWTWLTTKMPGFRWGLLRAYGRFWANRTRSVFSPAVEFEKQPWAFMGLAVIRALAILPVAKCFLRPLIPVAAAHLVRDQRASASPAPTEQPAPAQQPAAPTSNAA
ncbi:MAG TPA: hypothetical protein VK539_02030 [Myxococcaceae bacterium]|nr:hypothetical protein [Myxococcaceae bacterium]